MILSFWWNKTVSNEEKRKRKQKKLENYFGKNAKDCAKTMVHFRFGGSAIIVITLSGFLLPFFLLVYQNEMDTFLSSRNVFLPHSNLLRAKFLSQPSSHNFKQREEKTCPQPTSINEADGVRVHHCLFSWCCYPSSWNTCEFKNADCQTLSTEQWTTKNDTK